MTENSRRGRFFGGGGGKKNVSNLSDFLSPEEGNRVGLPPNIFAFDSDPTARTFIFGTIDNEVILYKSPGTSIAIKLDDVLIMDVRFLGEDTIFVLCEEGIVIKLEVCENALKNVGTCTIPLENGTLIDWRVSDVQTLRDNTFLYTAVKNEIFRISKSNLAIKVFVTKDDWNRAFQFLDESIDKSCRCILTSAKNPENMLLVGPDGYVVRCHDGKLEEVVRMQNGDGSNIRQLVWDSDLLSIYGIAENHKFTKWNVQFPHWHSRFDIKEMEGFAADFKEPFPTDTMFHLTVLKDVENNDDFIAYHGGKSEHSSDELNTITIRQGNRVAKFEHAGAIVAIRAFDDIPSDPKLTKKQGIFVVVTSNEVISIDMNTWKIMRPMYFYNVNNTELTCQFRALDVDENTWMRLLEAGKNHWTNLGYSLRPFPFLNTSTTFPNEANPEHSAYRQVHLTGHSSGNICIYASGGIHMYCILVIPTSAEFLGDIELNRGDLAFSNDPNKSLEQVAVQKVGDFDNYSDEKSFTITHLYFDAKKGTVIAANDGGFILSYDICDVESTMKDVNPVKISITKPSMQNTNTLIPRNMTRIVQAGYQPTHRNFDATFFQLCPNVPVTALNFNSKYNCISIGTDSGFFFVDLKHAKIVKKVDLHIDEGASEVATSSRSRLKSLKESVRQTFRRKKTFGKSRRGSSQSRSRRWRNSFSKRLANLNHTAPTLPTEHRDDSAVGMKLNKTQVESYGERQIEARVELAHSIPIWLVTCIQSLRFPLNNKSAVDDIIAVGTSGGKIQFFKIYEDHIEDYISFGLTKVHELRLSQPQTVLTVGLSCDEGYFSASSTRLIIITDLQTRLHSLPGFAKVAKYRLTAMEGLKICKGVVGKLRSSKDSTATQLFLILLTNNGKLRIQSLPNLQDQSSIKFLRDEDRLAMKSCILTPDGHATHIVQYTEFHRLIIQKSHFPWSNL
ncbi:unnamed protein product [Caenorhabditis angaria]|uniref:Lethal giant larvae homologue 2 domain-containing protein n=1 Tax=Caenorhabditis angaria TaxID=860376 RepID=A0A9P1J4T3_9PELO|nr:unnamed protein product [Caenorhabditis angaria]